MASRNQLERSISLPIGFADMVNPVEEADNPRRTLPLAIISFIAINAMSLTQLANSKSPIADIVKARSYSPNIIAIINGAIVQIIMASRMMYGMAKQNLAPKILSNVNRVTKTPIISTIISAILVIIFAISLPITTLARLTSLVMLSIFLFVNISLIRIKLKSITCNKTVVSYPIYLPIIASLLCGVFILTEVILNFL